MPGVIVLPPSPALGGFGPSLTSESVARLAAPPATTPAAMQNGAARDSVAEIKEAAREQAQKARGASAISLLKTARGQIAMAHAREGEGDLPGALSAFTKAALLAQMCMDSSEFKLEAQPGGKKGVLVKDFLEFQQVRDMLPGRELTLNVISTRAAI